MADTERQNNETVVEAVASTTQNKRQLVLPEPKLIRKFEIRLYNDDVDEAGNQKLEYVPTEHPIIVSAANKKELEEALKIYKDCGQIPKILREVDPPTKEQLKMFDKQLKAYAEYKAGKITAEEAIEKATGKKVSAPQQEETPQQSEYEPPRKLTIRQPERNAPIKQPPKYFKVGDIELKEDNGKMYQKQFIALTDVEASNIRVVDNKTNRILNLNGKRIEMKKWILVENQDEQETLEGNLI